MRREALRVPLIAVLGLIVVSGCVSFDAVETTPEGIVRTVEPGDTVRMTTRERGEMTLLVWSVNDAEIRGRPEGDQAELVSVRFDHIETIEVERVNLKKAMLTTLVPAVIAAIIVCNNQDCETRSVLTATQ